MNEIFRKRMLKAAKIREDKGAEYVEGFYDGYFEGMRDLLDMIEKGREEKHG